MATKSLSVAVTCSMTQWV